MFVLLLSAGMLVPMLARAEGDVPESAVPAILRVDLRGAIERALAANPDLKAGGHDVQAARARRDAAFGERLPALRNLTMLTESRRDQRLFPPASPGQAAVISHHLFGSDLLVSIPIFTGGRLAANQRAAELGETSVRQGVARTRDELVFNVRRLFFGILAQREFLVALAASDASLVEEARRISALVAERKAADVDRQRVEVRLASLRQSRMVGQSTLTSLGLELARLMDTDPRTVVEAEGDLGSFVRFPDEQPGVLVERALAQRPDVLAARTGLDVLARQGDAARAGHWPSLSIQGSYGLRWGIAPTEQPAGAVPVADLGQVALVMDLPLFLGGRVTAATREQAARFAAARERLRSLEARIRVEVESAFLDMLSARERLDVSSVAIHQAQAAFDTESDKHTEGKSTISDVLQAQADLVEAQANRIRALADWNTALAELDLATGEGP
jgi:outer membrane protein TolC